MWKIKQIQSERKENRTKWKRITHKNGENININGTEKHQKFWKWNKTQNSAPPGFFAKIWATPPPPFGFSTVSTYGSAPGACMKCYQYE